MGKAIETQYNSREVLKTVLFFVDARWGRPGIDPISRFHPCRDNLWAVSKRISIWHTTTLNDNEDISSEYSNKVRTDIYYLLRQ